MKIDGKEVVVGMTTCPRDGVSYIRESINSLIDNGWGVPLVYNDQSKRGDWWGFVKVTRLLLEAYPAAEYLVVVQDDVVACDTPFRLKEKGAFECSLLSLFTTSADPEKHAWSINSYEETSYAIQVLAMDLSSERKRILSCNGGIAYSMSRKFASELMEESFTKCTPTPQMLGEFCYNHGKNYNLATTNLFEHTGATSSLHSDKPGYQWNISKAKPFRKEADA